MWSDSDFTLEPAREIELVFKTNSLSNRPQFDSGHMGEQLKGHTQTALISILLRREPRCPMELPLKGAPGDSNFTSKRLNLNLILQSIKPGSGKR